MEFIWILFAFICGLAVKLAALPPLIGYLLAGFILHAVGFEANATLEALADLGITLMLFCIGLKLNIRDLIKVEVWAPSLMHMGKWVIACFALLSLLVFLGMPFLQGLDTKAVALLAFALSFSSTVCVVKLLEENGEMKTRHGRLAIAVLVIQDIAAVIFLVLATGKIPSLWALALFLLIPARPLIGKLLKHAGHGELMPLMGFFLALGGYELFELVGVKGDLGALLVGMLLSSHPKATELTKSLLSFKDLFLIGFFLSIGFIALPTVDMLIIATVLALLLPFKWLLFFLLFSKLRWRTRTSYIGAVALANYSEFGLIVASLSAELGWLPQEWLVILALSVSLSFVFTSAVYHNVHRLYAKHNDRLQRFQNDKPLPEDCYGQPKQAEILVVGLGRVGKGAFQSLHNCVGDRVWGMDADTRRIEKLEKEGLHVFAGDAEDADLWENLDIGSIKLVMLALPSMEDAISITEVLRMHHFSGSIAAIARYEDERHALLDAGIDQVFNFFTEAGQGFAEESLHLLEAAQTS